MSAAVRNQRKALHAYVSEEAHDAWHDFAAENGASVSAILESLAPALASQADTPFEVRLDQVVTEARRTDAKRRRRRS
jgi:hypothetical protein